MTVRRTSASSLALEGLCPIEDAEALLLALLETPGASIDWTGCEGAHTAFVQVMMAARIAPQGPPADEFLRDIVADALQRSSISKAKTPGA